MSIGSPCPDPKTIRSRLTVDEDLPHLVIVRTSSSGILTSVTDPVRVEACAVIWRAFFDPARAGTCGRAVRLMSAHLYKPQRLYGPSAPPSRICSSPLTSGNKSVRRESAYLEVSAAQRAAACAGGGAVRCVRASFIVRPWNSRGTRAL